MQFKTARVIPGGASETVALSHSHFKQGPALLVFYQSKSFWFYLFVIQEISFFSKYMTSTLFLNSHLLKIPELFTVCRIIKF